MSYADLGESFQMSDWHQRMFRFAAIVDLRHVDDMLFGDSVSDVH